MPSRINGHQLLVQEELAQIWKAYACAAFDAEFWRLLVQKSQRRRTLEEDARLQHEQEAQCAQAIVTRQVAFGKQVSPVQGESCQ